MGKQLQWVWIWHMLVWDHLCKRLFYFRWCFPWQFLRLLAPCTHTAVRASAEGPWHQPQLQGCQKTCGQTCWTWCRTIDRNLWWQQSSQKNCQSGQIIHLTLQSELLWLLSFFLRHQHHTTESHWASALECQSHSWFPPTESSRNFPNLRLKKYMEMLPISFMELWTSKEHLSDDNRITRNSYLQGNCILFQLQQCHPLFLPLLLRRKN